MDLCDEAFSRSAGLSSSSCGAGAGGGGGGGRESDSGEELKSCAGCQTTKTPLWRGGPTGPKSLCNACGIRYSKNRRTPLVPKEGGRGDEEKRQVASSAAAAVVVDGDQGSGLEVSLKLRVLGLGGDLILKQRSMIQKQRRRMMRRNARLGEVERAAKLLMALSSGALYA